jgi:hypothetical protein
MDKTLLIVKACGIEGEEHECNLIKTQAVLYGIKTIEIEPKNITELSETIHNGTKYDFIYLSSHGNSIGFGNSLGTINISWYEFGVMLCGSSCLNYNSILMLSCCRGGLNEVAYDLFFCCPNISFVVGPRQSLVPSDMAISFNILLYNLVHRNIDPIVACEKIKLGTDIRFVCFDRLEVQSDTGYLLRIARHQQSVKETQQLNQAREVANEPKVENNSTVELNITSTE